MTKFKKLLTSALAVGLLAATFTACGVSEEQYAELDALTAEVQQLEKDITQLKSDKAKLEREISEQNAKLDECAKQKADAQKNLGSIK